MKKKWLDYLIVYIGCVIQAFSIVCILKPNNLTVGGITGLSLTIGKLLNFNYTYIYYTICLGILVCAYIFLGKREVKKIVLLSTTYPLILIFMNKIQFNFLYDTPDKLLICIYYGIFMGVGTGLVLKRGFSQGSSDTVAKILHKKIFNFMSNTIHRGYSIGHVVGGKSKIRREKIISVCSLREAMLIKDFVTKIDEDAFINIVPTIGAWGKEDGLQNLKEK